MHREKSKRKVVEKYTFNEEDITIRNKSNTPLRQFRKYMPFTEILRSSSHSGESASLIQTTISTAVSNNNVLTTITQSLPSNGYSTPPLSNAIASSKHPSTSTLSTTTFQDTPSVNSFNQAVPSKEVLPLRQSYLNSNKPSIRSNLLRAAGHNPQLAESLNNSPLRRARHKTDKLQFFNPTNPRPHEPAIIPQNKIKNKIHPTLNLIQNSNLNK